MGTQYRSAIFYLNQEQKEISERLISMLKSQGLNVVTEIAAAGAVYEADEYHQDYYAKTGGKSVLPLLYEAFYGRLICATKACPERYSAA